MLKVTLQALALRLSSALSAITGSSASHPARPVHELDTSGFEGALQGVCLHFRDHGFTIDALGTLDHRDRYFSPSRKLTGTKARKPHLSDLSARDHFPPLSALLLRPAPPARARSIDKCWCVLEAPEQCPEHHIMTRQADAAASPSAG
jgi:hypothetical protein